LYEEFPPGASIIVLTLIAAVMYALIGQDFYQRLFASKGDKTAMKTAITSGIFLMVIAFIPLIAGVIALTLKPNT